MSRTNLVHQQKLTIHPEGQDSSNINIKTYAEIKAHYEANDCWGLLSSLDAKNCNGEIIRSAEAIKEYTIKLCDLIGMKRFQDSIVVNFGEDEKVAGYSLVQLIETSLVSGHFANLTNAAYIDIFSCKIYDPYLAAEFTREFFKASDAAVHICFRK
jgi:S-adenosylmethionine/arginine decarboxylase-like enzyme